MLDYNKTANTSKRYLSSQRASQKRTPPKRLKKISKENKKFLELIGLLK